MSTESCFNCHETMQRLNSYVDRELSDFELVEVKKHLDDCPPCEQHFEFNVRVKRLVRTKACPEKAPQELLQQILQSLKRA